MQNDMCFHDAVSENWKRHREAATKYVIRWRRSLVCGEASVNCGKGCLVIVGYRDRFKSFKVQKRSEESAPSKDRIRKLSSLALLLVAPCDPHVDVLGSRRFLHQCCDFGEVFFVLFGNTCFHPLPAFANLLKDSVVGVVEGDLYFEVVPFAQPLFEHLVSVLSGFL